MNVLIHYLQDSDPEMLAACLTRIKCFYRDDRHPETPVDVWCNLPDRDGSTHYLLRLPYTEGPGHMTVGALRRGPGQEIEFHS